MDVEDSDSNRESKWIVPWFSLKEWEEVYSQLYSDDTAVQTRGYERLLMWKARCPLLPAGVECTMILVHVILQDRELWPQIASGSLPPYREHDLRLMYSTAIMRFLNHISTVAHDGSDTMYRMAKKLHIPDWVVNIRHDMAHGLSVPPLAVLREALHFTLGWIHEHYWRGELELTENYVAEEVDSQWLSRRLQRNLEMWQALQLYLQAGYDDVNAIPDQVLKLRVQRLVTSGNYGLNDARDKVERRLLATVKKHAASGALQMLIGLLLDGEAFLPDEHLLPDMASESDKTRSRHTALPVVLLRIWQNLLSTLQSVNILPILITKLIELSAKTEESVYRRRMASIWLKEICDGLVQVREIHKLQETEPKKRIKTKCDKQISKQVLIWFHKKYPQYKGGLALRLTCLPDIDISLVKQAMLSPNKWSIIYVPSLLSLVKPALPRKTVASLVRLLALYTSEVVPIVPESEHVPVYTVQSLGLVHTQPDVAEPQSLEHTRPVAMVTDGDRAGGWSRSEGYDVWAKCPLGVLPWQRNMPVVDLALPSEITWTPSRPPARPPTELKISTLASVHQVDWNQLERRRKKRKIRKQFLQARRRKEEKASSNLVKHVFEIIGTEV